MKFKINKDSANKEFYDEFTYIQGYCKKYINNPKLTAKLATKDFRNLIIFMAVASIFTLMYIIFVKKDPIMFLCLGGFIMGIIVVSAILYNCKKKIDFYMEHASNSEFTIDEKGIDDKSSERSIKLKWEDIKHIVANKYSVCFIPSKLPGYFIGLPIEYKDEVLKALKKVNKEDLFFDNTDLY